MAGQPHTCMTFHTDKGLNPLAPELVPVGGWLVVGVNSTNKYSHGDSFGNTSVGPLVPICLLTVSMTGLVLLVNTVAIIPVVILFMHVKSFIVKVILSSLLEYIIPTHIMESSLQL